MHRWQCLVLMCLGGARTAPGIGCRLEMELGCPREALSQVGCPVAERKVAGRIEVQEWTCRLVEAVGRSTAVTQMEGGPLLAVGDEPDEVAEAVDPGAADLAGMAQERSVGPLAMARVPCVEVVAVFVVDLGTDGIGVDLVALAAVVVELVGEAAAADVGDGRAVHRD